jgi:hypothetical protein
MCSAHAPSAVSSEAKMRAFADFGEDADSSAPSDDATLPQQAFRETNIGGRRVDAARHPYSVDGNLRRLLLGPEWRKNVIWTAPPAGFGEGYRDTETDIFRSLLRLGTC